MNNSCFTYLGNVSIKYYLNGTLLSVHKKNSALEWMSRAFARFMSGYMDIKKDTPQYLDIKYREDSSHPWESILTGLIPISSKQYENDDNTYHNWIAKVSAAVNYNSLTKTVKENDAGQYRFYLCADNDTSYPELAYIPIEASELSRITASVQANVEWILQLKNNDGGNV